MIARLQAERESAFARLLAEPPVSVLYALRDLRAHGLRLAVLSNTDGSEVAAWQSSPFPDLVDVSVFSHQIGYVKPDGRAYHATAAALHLPAESCAFVGDGNSDELSGAAAVGMRPYCAAWFLRQHVGFLGNDVVLRRARAFPVLASPQDLVSALAQKGTGADTAA